MSSRRKDPVSEFVKWVLSASPEAVSTAMTAIRAAQEVQGDYQAAKVSLASLSSPVTVKPRRPRGRPRKDRSVEVPHAIQDV